MSRHSPFRRIIENSGSGGGGGGANPLWSVLFATANAGDAIDVTVPVEYDLATSPNYGLITLQSGGNLILSRTRSTQLNCAGMVRMSGSIETAGTESDPFPNTLTHTRNYTGAYLNEASGNRSSPASAVPTSNRGCMGMAGSIRYWVAQVPAINIVKLGATANAGDTSLTLNQAVTWKAGTVIEIGTTKYNSERPGLRLDIGEDEACSNYGTERATVAANVTNSTTVTLTAPLTYRHFGRLQYMTAKTRAGVTLEDIPGTNLSFTDYGILAGDVFGTTINGQITGTQVLACLAGLSGEVGAGGTRGRVLDNRCTVGVLSCPLKITCPDDADWWQYGYGATDMTMGTSSIDQMQGVEIFRCGKGGQLGAYPLHHHMRSYTPHGSAGAGTFLGNVDATLNYIKQCSVHDSSNRGVTIHGTCGFNLYKTVLANIDTHAIFLEDGSEINNVIDGNYVVGVNRINQQMIVNSAAHSVSPNKRTAIKAHDRLHTNRFTEAGAFFSSTFDTTNCDTPPTESANGPSGIWFSHPTNHLRNNIVIGAYTGIWNNFQRFVFGFSKDVTGLNAMRTTTLEHDNNEAGCCTFLSMSTMPHVVDEAGNIIGGPSGTDSGDNSYSYGVNVDNSYYPPDSQLEKFSNMNFWKSSCAIYQNEAHNPLYLGWHVAGVTGQANPRNFSHWDRLMIYGNGSPKFRGLCAWPNTLDDAFPDAPQTVMLSYHTGAAIEHSCFFAPSTITTIAAPKGNDEVSFVGGVIEGWDFYLGPVVNDQNSFFGNTRNTVIAGNSPGVPMINIPPPWSFPQFGTKWTSIFNPANTSQANHQTSRGVQSAIKLPPDGSFFNTTGWWVFDTPYALYGTTGSVYGLPTATADTTHTMNGKLLPATYDYYGLTAWAANGSINGILLRNSAPDPFVAAINYTRMQADGLTPVTGGTWNTPRWTQSEGQSWENMRHGIVLHGGFVDVSWPSRTDVPMPTSFVFKLDGFNANGGAPANAHFFMSVDFNNSTSVSTASLTPYGLTIPVASPNTRAGLLASSTLCYWQDTTNNKLWLHIVRPPADTTNYNPIGIRINDITTSGPYA